MSKEVGVKVGESHGERREGKLIQAVSRMEKKNPATSDGVLQGQSECIRDRGWCGHSDLRS